MKKYRLFLLLLFPLFVQAQPIKWHTAHIDKKGIIRWENNEEVGLFGANYCLPSACDYRAAGRITNDRKSLVDKDLTHFARMGWDALRLSFWGDFENSDKDGNLINNDHLDLMDYVIYKARERGIYILFSPIVTYSSQWPDAMADTSVNTSLSGHFKKSELGTNPSAIKAQCNYLIQILNHVNLYTGIALKDDPSILFVELINEPHHHSDDYEGSVKYINALVDAIRSTGCKRLLFHNVSQDMKIAKAIKDSKVDGSSFAWYPMGLVSGHRLTENNLRTVDDFTPMRTPELAGKPRIVYEFDEADSYTPYMYPAMVRSFRAVGAQFTTMFSYDMLATAPFNLGWQTHIMNMVFYPQKAVAGIIAAEMMKTLPLYTSYSQYPANTKFGAFRVSYEENLGEMLTADKFIYANTTTTVANAKTLKKIVGYGSSSLVNYPGKGTYFLDKVRDGVWRLEVYPDAILVNDPFEAMSPGKVVSRLISREWNMQVSLPDLGSAFYVKPVNKENDWKSKASEGKFAIRPGVYVLSVNEKNDKLPEKIGALKIDEYVCPEPMVMADNVILKSQDEYLAGSDVVIDAQVVSNQVADKVELYYRSIKYKNWFKKVDMTSVDGYTYRAVIPAKDVETGTYRYCVTVTHGDKHLCYPSALPQLPFDWDFYTDNQKQFAVVEANSPLSLLNPAKDFDYLAFSRVNDVGKKGLYDLYTSADGASSIKIYFPLEVDKSTNDYSVALGVKAKVLSRVQNVSSAKAIRLKIKGDAKQQNLILGLKEADGTTWTSAFNVSTEWQELVIPFSQLKVGKGVMLPQGYPCEWNYWIDAAQGRGGATDALQPAKIEQLQLSYRPSESVKPTENAWIEVSSILLVY